MTHLPMPQRVAVVTGATSGIGAEAARWLHQDGFAVLLTGRCSERGEAVARELGSGAACFVPADLTRDGEPDRLLDCALDRFGRVDAVVNNAAADHTGELLDVPTEEIRDTFEINTFAAIAVLQAAGRAMRQSGGSIINVTSRLATVGVPTMSVYSASKGAMKALTAAAAVELAPYDIRVNAVAPGMTRTPLYEAWLRSHKDPEALARRVADGIPLGRPATPQDVAAAIAFLASPGAAYITGITLPVDGGYTAQ
ncbi:SDR family NAD(P)-dependent oxidoreductase [Streptomyces sp. Ru72]|uniref:SDR family NAD(P)-dependent oxidoreductase n=1 Tax=Streptomyces sp. Ru72 TaxID=2080747 RepID=UPI0015E2E488|nr:glucose 1-dehydrogenase [Streptomyces sp. Ru72]